MKVAPELPANLGREMSLARGTMGWLKDHVYIAAWISPALALLGEESAEEGKDGPESADFYHVFITPSRFGTQR